MAALLMNNSITQHRPNTVPQATPGTRQGAPVVQQQNQAVARTLDEKVDQILVKAASLTRADDVREVSEVLERMLDPKYPVALRTRRRCFRGLVKLCGDHGVLPGSYIIPESKIEKLGDEPVSTGGFSEVWLGTYGGEENYVAIKVIHYNKQNCIHNIRKSFCREVITWRRLSHPHILELLGVMMTVKGNDEEFAMVSPWMDNGNIVDYVRDTPEANPLKLLEDATHGLQYLHSMDLAHGDLKGGNILVSDEGRGCLADVGLTRVAGDLSLGTATTHTSTTEGGHSARWCAPEILDPERFGSKKGGPTKRSDVYSMGMTIYEVLTGKVPFHEVQEFRAWLLIGDGVRPQKPNFLITRGYTEELWEATVSCWSEKPRERPTVDYVLKALGVAGEQWKPMCGGLSSQDDRDDCSYEEEESDPSTLSGSEGKPDGIGVSPSYDTPQPTETPRPATPAIPSSPAAPTPTTNLEILHPTPTPSFGTFNTDPAAEPLREEQFSRSSTDSRGGDTGLAANAQGEKEFKPTPQLGFVCSLFIDERYNRF